MDAGLMYFYIPFSNYYYKLIVHLGYFGKGRNFFENNYLFCVTFWIQLL